MPAFWDCENKMSGTEAEGTWLFEQEAAGAVVLTINTLRSFPFPEVIHIRLACN